MKVADNHTRTSRLGAYRGPPDNFLYVCILNTRASRGSQPVAHAWSVAQDKSLVGLRGKTANTARPLSQVKPNLQQITMAFGKLLVLATAALVLAVADGRPMYVRRIDIPSSADRSSTVHARKTMSRYGLPSGTST